MSYMPPDPVLADLVATKVASSRAALRMSQARLAELLDLDTSYISRIECGSRVPSMQTLIGLARALGWSVAETRQLALRMEPALEFLLAA